MPPLKYSTYQNLINSSLSKEELENLIKTIYVITLACLKQKYHDKSNGIDIEDKAIEVTVRLLIQDSKGQIKLTREISKYKNEIIDEVESNYRLLKIIRTI